ncbi:ABC transporter permease [Photobacterium lucens]|uniref:ABC transporter permease n=1 Tax=Photobacterium lucens TaxID=2562949 RepID=UPI001370385D|nr:FtsX-like permease family protein [Photobacterium lucens]MBP2699684.1 FtsX-like permease family protein [Vibrio parahaemolyticus]MZG56577.1 FtsX-like permease family protein [Photobacterium lucens]MZG82844.1 FtsX-like permease family protein [Photobacterium lucens]
MLSDPLSMKKRPFFLRWAWREIRQGQLWLVTLALSLIIACVFALSALVSRVEGIIVSQGRSALAADMVLRSSQAVDLELLSIKDVITSQQTRFGTMAFSDNGMQLVSVKAVDAKFPLRGDLRLQATDQSVQHHVKPGELWLSERLFSLLDVKVGDTLMVGDGELTISGRILEDPELSFNPFSQMPAVLINNQDIAAIGGIQEGSRLSYRYYFSGSDSALADIRKQFSLTPSQRWLTENDAGRSGDFIERARQYLSLTLVLVVLMASATLVLTCQHYAATRITSVAMMKSLGASRRFLWRWLLQQIAVVFSVAIGVGLILGFWLEWLLRYPLQQLLPDELPSIGFAPLVISLLLALFISLPALGIPLSRLVNASAMNTVQATQVSTAKFSPVWLLLIFPVLAAVAWIGTNLFVWLTLLGMVALLVLLALVGIAAIALLKKIKFGSAYALALSRVNRSKAKTATQLAALTCSLMLLAVIGLLRNELLADWKKTLPADAPNVFAINIAPEQQQAYLAYLDANQLARSDGYPVTRGRLVAINEQRFYSTEDESQSDALVEASSNSNSERDPALRRELNFTWAETLPSHNDVITGKWGDNSGVSVESGIAKRLNINLGDKLAFTVGGLEFNATVNSIRDVEWRNMKPNFYFIFTPDVLQSFPATWLVSFRINDQQSDLLNTLAENYPTVSVLDLRMMATRIQGLLTQVSWSLTVLAGLGVLSGLLLIMTLLRLSISERQTEIQLYRTLGASRKRIATTLWFEYGIIALLAGIIAAIGAEFVVGLLVVKGFELPFTLHPLMWLGLPVLAIGLVYLVSRSQIKKLLLPLR